MGNRWIVAIYLLLGSRAALAQVQPARTLSTVPKVIDGEFSPAIVSCFNPVRFSLADLYCTAVRDTVGPASSNVHAAVTVIGKCPNSLINADLTGQANALNFPVSQLHMTITPPGGVATTRQVWPSLQLGIGFAGCVSIWAVDLVGYGQFQVTVDVIDANGVHHRGSATGPQ